MQRRQEVTLAALPLMSAGSVRPAILSPDKDEERRQLAKKKTAVA